MNPEILLAMLELPAKERIAKILQESLPPLVARLEAKGGPTPAQVLQAEGFVGKILAIPPANLIDSAHENPRVLLALSACVATLSFRKNGIEIYGTTFKTPPEPQTPAEGDAS